MVKREIFEKVGGFKSPFPMTLDIDFWISILKYGNLYFIDEPLAYFRVHKNSYSVQKNANKEYRDWIKIKLSEKEISFYQYFYILIKLKIINFIKKIFIL